MFISPIFSQADLTGVPAAVFKWVIIILVGLAVAAAFIWTAFRTGGKQNIRIDQDPTPEFRKAPKRYNHDLAEERHRDLSRRLSKAEQDIKDIQESRLKAIHGIERRFNRIWIVLTKIATKMDIETPQDKEDDL
jgi:hypothetical protein